VKINLYFVFLLARFSFYNKKEKVLGNKKTPQNFLFLLYFLRLSTKYAIANKPAIANTASNPGGVGVGVGAGVGVDVTTGGGVSAGVTTGGVGVGVGVGVAAGLPG
jgi:hypothetical protein